MSERDYFLWVYTLFFRKILLVISLNMMEDQNGYHGNKANKVNKNKLQHLFCIWTQRYVLRPVFYVSNTIPPLPYRSANILVPMMTEYTVSGHTPESGSGSGFVMTETAMPSGQSWFHTHLIIHDLYWPLVGEIVILDTTSAIKNKILIIWSMVFLVGSVTFSCQGLHRIQLERASLPAQVFSSF